MALRKLGGTLALVLFTSLLTFLLLEFSFRAYLFGWNAFSVEMMNSVRAIGQSGLVTGSRCKDLVWELEPNLSTHFKLVPFETNSEGLRDREYDRERRPNTTRVAIVGDSYTMASGVAIEDAYHSVLEERLNESDPERGYEFINFGTGGYSLRQYVADIRCRVLKYDPDLVVVNFVPKNDHRVPGDEMFEKPYVPLPPAAGFYSSFVWEEIAEDVKRTWKQRTSKGGGAGPEPTEKQVTYMEEVFAQLGELSREEDLPILVVYLTYRTDRKVSAELIGRMATENGLDFLDPSSAFEGTNPKKFRIFPSDGHPDAVANRMFADELYEDVRAKLDELRR